MLVVNKQRRDSITRAYKTTYFVIINQQTTTVNNQQSTAGRRPLLRKEVLA